MHLYTPFCVHVFACLGTYFEEMFINLILNIRETNLIWTHVHKFNIKLMRKHIYVHQQNVRWPILEYTTNTNMWACTKRHTHKRHTFNTCQIDHPVYRWMDKDSEKASSMLASNSPGPIRGCLSITCWQCVKHFSHPIPVSVYHVVGPCHISSS